jgi:hypothetical protein
VLLAPPWAEEFEDGSPTPTSFGIGPVEHDFLARRYYDAARRALPTVNTIGSEIRTTATAHHQWGPAPFHFSQTTSQELADILNRLAHAPEYRFPLPRPIASHIAPRAVRVEVPRSWASDVALYVLTGKKILLKFPYQRATSFVVTLPGPGTYRFRAFHRLEDHTATVDSDEVLVPTR